MTTEQDRERSLHAADQTLIRFEALISSMEEFVETLLSYKEKCPEEIAKVQKVVLSDEKMNSILRMMAFLPADRRTEAGHRINKLAKLLRS